MNTTPTLPRMETNCKGENNTNENRNKFFREMLEAAEYKREFDFENRDLHIWFMMADGKGCKVSMHYTPGSHFINIEYFRSKTTEKIESHKFSPDGFLASVYKNFLTPEDLKQQRMFEQEKERQDDDLINAHQLKPRQCGGVGTCKHCDVQERIGIHNAEILHKIKSEEQHGPNWRSIVGPGGT
jgi:hypothetical protein